MAAVYTTVADVRAATGMNNTTNISNAYITAKIEMVQGIINGMIGDVYLVPFASGSVPDTIKALALNYTMGLLYIDQFGQETEGTGIDGDKIVAGVEKQLEKIRLGKLRLLNTDGQEITRVELRNPVGYPNQSSTDDGTTERAFTRDQKF